MKLHLGSIPQKLRLRGRHHDAHGLPEDCLNCQAKLIGPFCHQCGQSAHTHRYSIGSFLAHDLVHSFFHMDRSVVVTLWEVMIRPGSTARKNLAGQRARYFPIITLLLLLVGLYIAMGHGNVFGLVESRNPVRIGSLDITASVIHNQKWILLSTIPLIALVAWAVYRRPRYNYSEHVVIASHAIASVFAWLCLLSLLPRAITSRIGVVTFWVSLAFFALILWQAYGTSYKPAGFLWRTLLYGGVFFLLLLVLFLGIIFYGNAKGYLTIEGL